MQVMYLLFKYKRMLPSEYYWLPLGEKRVLAYFIKREIEERQEEIRQLYGGDNL